MYARCNCIRMKLMLDNSASSDEIMKLSIYKEYKFYCFCRVNGALMLNASKLHFQLLLHCHHNTHNDSYFKHGLNIIQYRRSIWHVLNNIQWHVKHMSCAHNISVFICFNSPLPLALSSCFFHHSLLFLSASLSLSLSHAHLFTSSFLSLALSSSLFSSHANLWLFSWLWALLLPQPLT